MLPAPYARWIDSLIAGAVPEESRATCDDCAMCDSGTAPRSDDAVRFDPRIKCCGYVPKLANFLVGAILADRDPGLARGRETIERRIAARIGVGPLGLDRAPDFEARYDSREFGSHVDLRCPHHVDEGGGRCGIWAHRNGVCATWFCKHERGAVGMAFWIRVRDLLVSIEAALAEWCVAESDIGGARGVAGDGADSTDERRLWGRWLGREQDFYRAAARRVATLSWADVLAIGGTEVELRAALVRAADRALAARELPSRLSIGTFTSAPSGRDRVRLSSYSRNDPIDLSAEIFELLPLFDGRRTSRVLADIETRAGYRVGQDLLRTLVDWEILRPASE